MTPDTGDIGKEVAIGVIRRPPRRRRGQARPDVLAVDARVDHHYVAWLHCFGCFGNRLPGALGGARPGVGSLGRALRDVVGGGRRASGMRGESENDGEGKACFHGGKIRERETATLP